MATTTNFGWATPNDTDFVKDGAAAIRTLGNSIDTSLVDLKGGTTGQILSKASATDLDYTWITNDVGDITAVTAGTGLTGGGTSGAVSLAIDSTVTTLTGTQTLTNKTLTSPVLTTPSISNIDAKGDLLAGTADNTIGRLAVGANGTVLTADSAEATGMKWAAASSGFKGCALTNSATQSIANATVQAVTFNTETFDTDAFHSIVSNTSRITIPAGLAGKYQVNACMTYAGNSTGLRTFAVYKNGAVHQWAPQSLGNSGLNAGGITFATIIDLAVSDYIEIFAYQTSGGALNLNANSDISYSVAYLGA